MLGRALIFALAVLVVSAEPANAQETPTSRSGDLFFEDSTAGKFYRFGEIFFNVVSAYHAVSIPHEAMHAATAYTYGTKTKYCSLIRRNIRGE